mmetsp:Transcript_18320/g.50519  ORF Transcript_18320/g.50519 Transcript_18320/m.50519 type:complete len:207 (+) Transcript_18320:518-1138(+)
MTRRVLGRLLQGRMTRASSGRKIASMTSLPGRDSKTSVPRTTSSMSRSAMPAHLTARVAADGSRARTSRRSSFPSTTMKTWDAVLSSFSTNVSRNPRAEAKPGPVSQPAHPTASALVSGSGGRMPRDLQTKERHWRNMPPRPHAGSLPARSSRASPDPYPSRPKPVMKRSRQKAGRSRKRLRPITGLRETVRNTRLVGYPAPWASS